MSTRLCHVVVEAIDPPALSSFWVDVLGWRVVVDDRGEVEIAPIHGAGVPIVFVPTGISKRGKNRIHFDLATDSVEEQGERVAWFTSRGARPVDVGQGDDAAHAVLTDPEGNEFCVSPPGFGDTGPIGGITFDAADPMTLAYFWSVAAGWPVVRETDRIVALRSLDGTGPYILVLKCDPGPAPKVSKNRVHLDVAPLPDGDNVAEAERLVGSGARHIDVGQEEVSWIVLADPEDNEFCVLTPE